MHLSNPITIPAETHNTLKAEPHSHIESDPELGFEIPCKMAVGCVLFVMILAGADIAFPISRVAKYTSKPCHSNWMAIKRIYRYLQGTVHIGILDYGTINDLRLVG